jgi:hypothetical protein
LNGKPFTDICDDLKGKYPKTFKFTGWHPLCRCHAVSILKTPEEFMREKEAIMEGKEPDAHSVNEVKDVPENFKKWVEDNKDRIAKAEKRGTLPYFIKDNRNTVDSAWRSAGIFNTAYGTTNIGRLKPTEILDLSNIDKTLRDKFKQDFTRGFTGIEAAPVGETYFMSTDINGKIFVNFASKDGFDSGTSLVNAFEKLKNGQSLTQDEEYSIEILWHEILHNKSKNTVILPPVNAVDTGFQRVAAETVNQLVARKTYPEFLKQLGGTAKHADWVLENGYGYKETVANMRKLLNTLDIDNRKFYIESEKLLMQDYTNFDKKIVNLMEDMSGRKNLMNVFGFIERDDFDNYLKILNKGR